MWGEREEGAGEGRLTLQQPNRRKTPSGGRMMAKRISRNLQQLPSPMVASELIGSEAAGWRPEICSLLCPPGARLVSGFVNVSLVGRARDWEGEGGSARDSLLCADTRSLAGGGAGMGRRGVGSGPSRTTTIEVDEGWTFSVFPVGP